MFSIFRRSPKPKNNISLSDHSENEFPIEIYKEVQANIENIKTILESPSDLVTRVFTIGNNGHLCGLVCIDGLVDKDLINDQILKNIQLELSIAHQEIPACADELFKKIENVALSVSEAKKTSTLDEVMLAILSGEAALFIEGTTEVMILGTKGWASRGVEEPITEALIRGPRDGFTENLRTNTAHIRRHVRDPNLRMDSYRVGRRSKKDLIVLYIAGITHPDLVAEVKRRVESIDIDDAPESGIIEQWIQDSFLTPFPQLLHTERPDKVAAGLTGGRVAILLDGTPFALIAPITFSGLIQSPEDYYERWQIGTLLRSLRLVAAFMATFLPSLYIALVSYHPGMIPSKLAFSIASTREGVPFPAVVEAFIMEVTLEFLREAGVRLPKPIGQTIGIVGGLVIGEAAVSAGVVSPIMVIVVALTAIASFSLPSYSLAISLRIIRFGVMLSAAMFGLFGVILAYIMINIHIANLKSFGIPYSTPFAPTFLNDWKDLVLRAPLTMLNKRPQMMKTEDPIRQDQGGKKR